MDAEEAMSVAASGDVQFCLYTTLILCFDDDESRLDESAGARGEDGSESRICLPGRDSQLRSMPGAGACRATAIATLVAWSCTR